MTANPPSTPSFPSPRPPEPKAIGLVIIGDEILSGKRADKHLAQAIALLAERGLALAYADYVGDDPDRITATLARAFASGDLVFSFGGIGATPDDHTRQAAARALGLPLALHPQAAALIRERMQDLAREQGRPYDPEQADNLHRLNMGVFPEGAAIIPNPYNKIPGFSCVGEGGGQVHFVPGFPVMAWPMLAWVLATQYAHLFHRQTQRERSVIVMGAREATLRATTRANRAGLPASMCSAFPVSTTSSTAATSSWVSKALACWTPPMPRCWPACSTTVPSSALNWCGSVDALLWCGVQCTCMVQFMPPKRQEICTKPAQPAGIRCISGQNTGR